MDPSAEPRWLHAGMGVRVAQQLALFAQEPPAVQQNDGAQQNAILGVSTGSSRALADGHASSGGGASCSGFAPSSLSPTMRRTIT